MGVNKQSGEMTTQEAIEAYGRSRAEVIDLKVKMTKLTGHAIYCEIQVDPEWKPCTCGRG